MLHVLESNVLVEEYKVSHILMTTNPMEGPKEIKISFIKLKQASKMVSLFLSMQRNFLWIRPLRSKEELLAGSQKN